jgi:hypothetical protein
VEKPNLGRPGYGIYNSAVFLLGILFLVPALIGDQITITSQRYGTILIWVAVFDCLSLACFLRVFKKSHVTFIKVLCVVLIILGAGIMADFLRRVL